MDATVRVLSKVGYDHASTNRVAQVAGVSVGSLYQYFPNKEALVVALVDRYHQRLMSVLFERLEEVAEQPIADAVSAVIHALVDAHNADPTVHRILSEQIPRIGKLGDLLRDIEVRSTPVIQKYLEARRSELRIRDLQAAASILVIAVQSLTDRIAHEKDPSALSRLVEATCDLVSHYLVGDTAGANPKRPRNKPALPS